MGMKTCPKCGTRSNEALATCYQCGAPLPRAIKPTWKIGLYVLSICLIVLGILFLWASPVANTGPRLLVGIVMIALGITFIILMRKRRAVARPRYLEEVGNEGLTEGSELTCKFCGATLGEDSVSLIDGTSRLVCPQCKHPYEAEEEPKW